MVPGCVPFKIVSDSPTLHSRWLLFFKVMIISLWNLLQYHFIVRWAIQAQWAEPLVLSCDILIGILQEYYIHQHHVTLLFLLIWPPVDYKYLIGWNMKNVPFSNHWAILTKNLQKWCRNDVWMALWKFSIFHFYLTSNIPPLVIVFSEGHWWLSSHNLV